ncbi:MAG: PD-(D/E)XK motif protein [Myxococcales bacterium]|nr:PD-(D/E)XK motif protein [Myxococcales bacterium]
MSQTRSSEREQLQAAEAAAMKIVRQMHSSKRGRWTLGDCTFGPSGSPEYQYGYASVFALDDRIDFSIWVDRAGVPPVPVICAAFGTQTPSDGRQLRDLAKHYEVPCQTYTGGQLRMTKTAIFEAPANETRYLSTYRHAGDFTVADAVRQFTQFWSIWADRVASIVRAPPSDIATDVDDESHLVLQGLIGELAVLAEPGMEDALWCGPEDLPYDIERDDYRIEVKATSRGRTPILSRAQIEQHADRFLVAIVDVPPDAHPKPQPANRGGGLHSLVKQHTAEIASVLRRKGLKATPDVLAQISDGVTRSRGRTTFHHLTPPAEFFTATEALENVARVVALRVAVDDTWLQRVEPPWQAPPPAPPQKPGRRHAKP